MMGQIGMEPEITREFLEKEYREACKTIAGQTERIASLEVENKRLLKTLSRCEGDINWMLNNEKLLNPDVFDYLCAALSGREGLGR